MTPQEKARELLAQLDGGDRVEKLVRALREERERALEEAAKVAENRIEIHRDGTQTGPHYWLAEAIRELKEGV